MSNFIDQLIDFTSDAESPTEFWRWAALSCLSTVLRDNVYLDVPIGVIYPNMYVIIYSDSGIARKAAPCQFVGKLIEEVGNTKFIAGRASMQAVVRELGNAYNNGNGNIITGAAGIIYSEELSSAIVDDPATIPLLIDLYDYHEKWASHLISGNSALKNVCVSLLAASNSNLFNSVYTEKALAGGLLGRTLIIKGDKPRHRKSLLDIRARDHGWIELISHLKRLAKLKGIIKFDKEAEREYNHWYYSVPEEVFIDKIGFGSRLGTHVFKVALALAASRFDFNKDIHKQDVEESIILCQGLRATYRQISFGIGASSNSYKSALIIKAIVSEPGCQITRRKLIQRTFGDVDSVESLDTIMNMMTQGGIIEDCLFKNEVGFRLTAKGAELLMGATAKEAKA